MTKSGELKAEIAHLRDSLRAEQEEVRQLRKRIEDMTEDHQAELARYRAYVEQANEAIENYGFVFGLQEIPEKPGFVQSDHADLIDKHTRLVEKYNRLVREWNTHFGHREPRGRGRPLEASKDQIAEVNKLRKAGGSLRGIADETGLSLSTVRTILAQPKRKAEKRSREQDRLRAAEYRARKRTKDKLVKKTRELLERGRAILEPPPRPYPGRGARSRT